MPLVAWHLDAGSAATGHAGCNAWYVVGLYSICPVASKLGHEVAAMPYVGCGAKNKAMAAARRQPRACVHTVSCDLVTGRCEGPVVGLTGSFAEMSVAMPLRFRQGVSGTGTVRFCNQKKKDVAGQEPLQRAA